MIPCIDRGFSMLFFYTAEMFSVLRDYALLIEHLKEKDYKTSFTRPYDL